MVSTAFAQEKRYDAKTWIPKLSDPRESERALTELEQLGDPSAIDGIAAAWEANGKPPRFLKVIVGLARPLTPQQAKDAFFVDYEQTGRPASWQKALPVLAKAATTFDPSNPREVDGAWAAVSALGEANLPASAAPLAKVVAKPADKHSILVEVEAVRALGKLTAARREAAAALRGVLAIDASKDDVKLSVVGAAINAAGELHEPSLVPPVIGAMFKNPPLFMQARRALASLPKSADALRDVVRTQRDGAKVFYAAIVLGDLRDSRSVPELVAVLGRPGLPPYPDSPSTTHEAAVDALRRIGSRAAAKPLAAIWRDAKREPAERARAISAYPYVADDAGDELIAIAVDNSADDVVRQEAALAGAMLVDKHDAADAYNKLAARYYDEAAKREGNAAKTAGDASAGEIELKVAKKTMEDAKANALKRAQDPKATAAEIKAATEAAKQAEDSYKQAKRHNRELSAPHREAESLAKGYIGFGRMFQSQIGAIDLAVRCKQEAKCYADTLSRSPNQLVADVAGDVDTKAWSVDDKAQLRAFTMIRAMIELARRGTGGDAVLARLGDDDRLVRQAAILVLPRVAPKPCAACGERFDAVIKASEGKGQFVDLDAELKILRSFYAN